MVTYNIYNKKWKKTRIPKPEDIKKIVGEDVWIKTDSLGNITIEKEITDEEKIKIEELSDKDLSA